MVTEFVELPIAWVRLLSGVNVRHLELSPDGTASLFIDGPVEQIEHLVGAIRVGRPVGRSRRTVPASGRLTLSHRQLEALSNAVALGYFEVPPKLDLRALAKCTGMSHGALSGLLRRAGALVVSEYIDALTESRREGPLPRGQEDRSAPQHRARAPAAPPFPPPRARPRKA